MDLRMVQEVENLVVRLVLDDDHVLGQVFGHGQEASFGVEPGVCRQLLVVRLERLHDSRDAELVIAFGAIEGSDDQVDDTEVEYLSLGIFDGNSFLFLFDAFHQFFGIGVLGDHDVRNT